MKKIKDILFSMKVTVVLLIIFATAIGYATFIENSQGTAHAKEMVYNARWFELLLILLIISLIGSIFKYKLIDKRKWSVLLFHVAFICILAGSAITRYFGYEGIMHIREGETTNLITTDKTAVKITVENNGQKSTSNVEVNFSPGSSNEFTEQLQVNNKTITVENKLYIPNAIETIEESADGQPVVGIFIMSGADQSMDIILFGNERKNAGDITFAFDNQKDSADILFSINKENLYFKSNQLVTKTGTMASGMIDRANAIPIKIGDLALAEQNTVYRIGKLVFMIKGFYAKASKTLTVQTEDNGFSGNALVMEVSDGQTTKQINVLESDAENPSPAECNINGTNVQISFGKQNIEIPFSLTLRKFELERYQGSMSPSSYASEITVTDTTMKTVLPYRIFMNNILDYRGYRFFQSSYDTDEKGTVLSVNHDFWGTMITYTGYFLMFFGMLMTLFNKNSRFSTLLKLTSQIQEKRKQITIILILITGFASTNNLYAQNTKAEHFKSLDAMLIQDGAQGRIEPLCTYTSDVLRKIYKHNNYKNQSATEVIIEMSVNPDLWRNEPIIKVSNPDLEKELGAVNGYISFNQVFDNQGNYKLSDQVEKAYQKEESGRNKYEKEIINVDERINICNLIYTHDLLAIFPNINDATGKWMIAKAFTTANPHTGTSACPYCAEENKKSSTETMDMSAMSKMSEMDEGTDAMGATMSSPHAGMEGVCTRISVHGGISAAAMSVQPEANSPEMLFSNYLNSVSEALSSGNWAKANTDLQKIKDYQLKYGGTDLPSATSVNLEIAYNNWNIFNNLMIAYAIIGFLLLILHFMYIFKPNTKIEKALNIGIYPLYLLFAVYTAGLVIRWYISGHAPWSNGYESMIFVGWASSLSGFVFARKSAVAFSVTALLSAIALSVAAMSWMNPEITNLVPVLKSYWLVIHVAIITSSYGFLAMGAILGFLNLTLMVSRNKKNHIRIDSNILEISYIIELALIVGLFMLTVGTFIGGIWANESWGRYWGWDAKETWALVSVLVYAIVLHLRLIPGMNKPIVISTAALISFSSVIMTFLGVNYYLSGMHSYGKGTPPPIPSAVYIILIIIAALVYQAFINEKKLKKQ